MPKVEDIIKTAQAEVGVTEYPPNSNNVKYNTEYYGKPVFGSNYPWCCVFVWWVFKHQSKFILKKTARCTTLGEWFKDNGRWYTTPQVGDVVFFKFPTNNRWTNHVGIVKSIKGSTIETIEGNTSVNSDDNGGAVMIRQRTSNIVGYGRPAYDNAIINEPIKPAPKKYKYGLDLSANQGNVDFNKVKAAGYEFVILRSTTKNGQTDTKFEQYYNAATKAGLKVAGVYKYSYAMSVVEAHKEAESVIKLLNGRKIDIWYDLEDKSQLILGTTGIGLIATAFLTYCVNKGYNVGIYCNKNWYDNYIPWDIKNICRFWVARYGKNTGQLDEQYKPSGKGVVMWQFTSKGQVDGITGNVDLNVRL